MSSPKLNLIAAACNNMGIGVNGRLPWRLETDRKYYQDMTTGTPPEGKQNVIIMGRATWECVPLERRPRKGRINIVLSRTLSEKPEGSHFMFDSLEAAVEHLMKPEVQAVVHHVWITGGSAVYKAAMDSPHCHRIYLTRVFTDAECDTFFPEIDKSRFSLVSDPSVNGEVQEENGIKFQYLVYERN